MASGFREGKRRAVQLNIRLHGQAVKTPPFHGGNRGSIPLGVTKEKGSAIASFFFGDGEGNPLEKNCPVDSF